MAKNRNRSRNTHRLATDNDPEGSPAELETMPRPEDEQNNADDEAGPRYPESSYAAPEKPTTQRGFFTLYKRNQGRNTRLGTAIGVGILIGGLIWFLYDQLEVYSNLYLQTGIAGGIGLIFAVLAYYLVGVNHRTCDFLIATDGELKKVNWSTRKEVIGSTKVVIATTLIMAILLFLVDIVFLEFFKLIGVWEATG
jgi:preprotein translocase SecE subunit